MSSEQVGGGSGGVSDRMRALLSRAAEEQLLEQRQVSTVLGELRALLEDVDERLVTGEQVERVAADVRQVSARLDAVQARSDELDARISDATAMVGQAAQDLVDAVAARVAEQLGAQLRELTSGAADSLGERLERSERRLATHVDDAVLALAEVVLRRRRPAVHEPAPAPAAPAPVEDAADVEDAPAALARADEPAPLQQDEPAVEDAAPDEPAPPDPAPEDGEPPPEPLPDSPPAGHQAALDAPVSIDLVAAEAPEPAPVEPFPGDGYVLVPADVADADAEPAPVVQHERRTAERRTAERSDGSGRRQRPWWRRV